MASTENFPDTCPTADEESDSTLRGASPSPQVAINQSMLRRITDAINDDPEVDILSIIPESYVSKMGKVQIHSELAMLNRRTIDSLLAMLKQTPDIHLVENFPQYYDTEYQLELDQMDSDDLDDQSPPKARHLPDHTLACLASIREAIVVFPLSQTIHQLLLQRSEDYGQFDDSEALAKAIKHMLGQAEKISEFTSRGSVYKCTGDIAVKVTHVHQDLTEYNSLLHLATPTSEIRPPRLHGLVQLGDYSIIFMSYNPSMALGKGWPLLLIEQKINVQNQLNTVMFRHGKYNRSNGLSSAVLGSEGANDRDWGDYQGDEAIEVSVGFEVNKSSVSKSASQTYCKFLVSSLPSPATQAVLIHGELREADNTIGSGGSNNCAVTGVIDWEDNRFYADDHESIKCTTTLCTGMGGDWYLYIPACIAPSTFSQWCLVDRLGEIVRRQGA